MRLGAASFLVALGAAACLEPRPVATGSTSCGQCHGEDGSGAPPPDLLGNTDRTARGVGAHAAHVGRAGLGCSECHPVPAAVDAPGHLDAAVQVAFGDAARRNGARPKWDGLALSCAETYCHASAAGGADPAPVWTEPLSSQCGACHGAPPPPPHPKNEACETCHPPAASAEHLDATVDLRIQDCRGCHGDAATIWPDQGAHRAHEKGASVGRAVACSECHRVPAEIGDGGHRNGGVEVGFGALASKGERTPAWDEGAGTCSGAYCHLSATPRWEGGSAEVACGSCHSLPPPYPHPTQPWPCQGCHVGAFVGDGLVRETHVDGEVTF